MDIVVVRAMADKRKLQGKKTGGGGETYVAQDPSHCPAWHVAQALRTFDVVHIYVQ